MTTTTTTTTSATSPLTREEVTGILDEGREYRLKSSGRTLGYLLVGEDLRNDDDGTSNVVVLCNGSPASRLEAKVYARDAKDAGACLVCVDRHGYGRSDLPERGEDRSILRFARDVDELVTRHLGVASYGVVGASAGGVNALALLHVAAASPSPRKKVEKAALIAPIGPIYQTTTRGMSGFFRLFLWLGAFAPSAVAFLLRKMLAGNREKFLQDPASLDAAVDGFTAASGKLDRQYLESLDRERLRCYALSQAEVFRNHGNVDGVNSLNTLLTQPWGFGIQDIRGIKVDIFASRDDDMVPSTMAEHIARQLGDSATLHLCRQEGHTSVIGRKMKEALLAILS